MADVLVKGIILNWLHCHSRHINTGSDRDHRSYFGSKIITSVSVIIFTSLVASANKFSGNLG